MKKRSEKQIYRSLLDDDLFFQWLLYPIDELDLYWSNVMQKHPEKKEAVEELKKMIRNVKVVDNGLSPDAKKDLWHKIETAAFPRRKTFKFSSLLRYAAVFCALAIATYFYTTKFYLSDKPIDYQSLLPDSSVMDSTSGNVTILLANQKKIEVEETNVELRYDTEGRMSVNSKVVEKEDTMGKPETEFNHLLVPYGKTTNIVLSDGSKIWVNSGSRVVYPSAFAANKREVYVEGEMYLEVVKNEKAPFIVKTNLLEINVLGTSFNVSAYKNDDNQSVVLATGSVSVKGIQEKTAKTILPNQKYTFETNTHTCDIQQVDVFDHICWKYGFLAFRNEKLDKVLKKMERYYNIRIHCDESPINRTSVSGKLDLKEDIQETLRIISITAPIEYHVQDQEINIHVKH